MKVFILTFTLLAVIVSSVKGTKDDIQVTEDKEFKQFMNDFNNTLTKNKVVQFKADEAQVAIVEKTVSKMIEMKQEVSNLKTELNEVKTKLDSVNADTATSFNILAISNH